MIGALWLIALCGFVAAAPPTKPNIVFVLVDDWGFADTDLRNPAIKTPNFDTLMNTGLILNRHYVFKPTALHQELLFYLVDGLTMLTSGTSRQPFPLGSIQI